jgi:GNAT superfamily N-acetyltransferase
MRSTQDTNYKVRKGGQEDLLGVLVLAKEFSIEAPKTHKFHLEKTNSFLNTAIESPNMEIFVAEVDGQIVGFMIAVVTEFWMSKLVIASDLAWFVTKEFRGHRVAIKLLKTFEAWGKANGANYLGMADIEGIQNLSKLYNKLGYKTCETTYLKEV